MNTSTSIFTFASKQHHNGQKQITKKPSLQEGWFPVIGIRHLAGTPVVFHQLWSFSKPTMIPPSVFIVFPSD